MKKILLVIGFILFISPFNVNGDTTDKYYMDINILNNGDLHVKEIISLTGDYNGLERILEYANMSFSKFSGIESDIEKSSIYNGDDIYDIKVYDVKGTISFNSFDNLNKRFEETSSTSNKYGNYNLIKTANGYNLKIYNKSNNETSFYIEYKIKNVIVKHNDISELYFNILGDGYKEDVSDFEAKIHLPKKDDNLLIWLHGQLHGTINTIDKQTIIIKYNNLSSHNAVTPRIVFSNGLVNTLKVSNIDAKNWILNYEKKQSDLSNEEREKAYLILKQEAESALLEVKENLTYDKYDTALHIIKFLKEEDKNEFIKRLEAFNESIDLNMRNASLKEIKNLEIKQYQYLSYPVLENINNIRNENYKKQLLVEYEKVMFDLNKIYNRQIAIASSILVLFIILVSYYSYKKYKKYNKDIIVDFTGDYYREFPRDYNPGIVEALINNKTISANSFSANILNLIYKKIVSIDNTNPKDVVLVLKNETLITDQIEKKICDLLFNIVGTDNRVSINDIKNYGLLGNSNANEFIKIYNSIISDIKQELDKENYYVKPNINYKLLLVILITVLSIFLYPFKIDNIIVFQILIVIASIVWTISNAFVITYSTKGKTDLIKWKAHKKFLLDFGRFDEKELPEVILWEKYLVIATALGISKKVIKSMEIQLTKYDSSMQDMTDYIIFRSLINSNIINTINDSFVKSVSNSNSTIAASQSSSSSGSGGGASFGGGFGGGGGGGGRF